MYNILIIIIISLTHWKSLFYYSLKKSNHYTKHMQLVMCSDKKESENLCELMGGVRLCSI